jgi:hypothetical protein
VSLTVSVFYLRVSSKPWLNKCYEYDEIRGFRYNEDLDYGLFDLVGSYQRLGGAPIFRVEASNQLLGDMVS